MSFITEMPAQTTAGLGMTHWATTTATKAGTKSVWKAGRGTTALTPSAQPTAASVTVTASLLGSVSVVWAGRALPAASV